MKKVFVDTEQTGLSLTSDDTWEVALIVEGSEYEGEWLFQIAVDEELINKDTSLNRDTKIKERYTLWGQPKSTVAILKKPEGVDVRSNTVTIKRILTGARIFGVNPTWDITRLNKALFGFEAVAPVDVMTLLVGYTTAKYGYSETVAEREKLPLYLGINSFRASNDLLSDLRKVQDVYHRIVNQKELRTPEEQDADAQAALEANPELMAKITEAANRAERGEGVPYKPRTPRPPAKKKVEKDGTGTA